MFQSTNQSDLDKMRHTAAHVLAAAARELKPETKLGLGPATENGFFHDLDVKDSWTRQDLPQLQRQMEAIKKKDLPIKQRTVSKQAAKKLFRNDPYKLDLIEEIKADQVGLSDMGNGWFVTLCQGGHVASTGRIGHFKLTHLSGVYWQGDKNKPQLQRIFGVLFPTQAELKQYLALLAKAKERDHRRLGKKLDLFTFSPLVGPGLPLFTPRGTIIRRELEDFVQSLQEPRGYERVFIPHIAQKKLYETSGHWEKFKADLFHVQGTSQTKFVMKPMNCPHHTQIYASRKRSYKDLPLRFSEVTTCYRDEQVGELRGLSRLRAFTQDDAHVFCTPDQVQIELENIFAIITAFYNVFSFTLRQRLSLWDPTTPEKYLGTPQIWQQAQDKLRRVLVHQRCDYFEAVGEAAFYGPKIDFIARDALQRDWQLATIQLDFNLPARFDLKYTNNKGQEVNTVMIHRAILGSVERFIAILLEHYAGALPLWLSPTQVKILPLTDQQSSYARQVTNQLIEANIRVAIDDRPASIAKKIREAQLQKIPVMAIIGPKEQTNQSVSVRHRDQGDLGNQPLAKFLDQLAITIKDRQ